MRPSPAEIDLPGVTPSRQQRSRDTTAALLRAGADMLRSRSLADVSIESLCAEVDATVGAFYSRFDSKQAYFNALIELATRDGARRLAELAQAKLPKKPPALPARCNVLVAGITGWIRAHEGVLRAALQHDARQTQWSPFKTLARATTAHATPLLLPAMGRGRKAAKTRAIAFGLQVVLGTLVNAILNDPGPLRLRDKEMERRLADCLRRMLEAEMG